jgi:hypothetical protein
LAGEAPAHRIDDRMRDPAVRTLIAVFDQRDPRVGGTADAITLRDWNFECHRLLLSSGIDATLKAIHAGEMGTYNAGSLH